MKLRMTIGKKNQLCVITIGLTGMIVKPIRVTNGVLNQIADFHYQINENIEDSVEKMRGMAKENESVGEQIQETYCMIQENSAHAKKLKTIVKKYIL